MRAARRAGCRSRCGRRFRRGRTRMQVTLTGLSFSPGTRGVQCLSRVESDRNCCGSRRTWRWRASYHGCGGDGGAGGSAGCELRSREFLLAAGTAAGSGRDDVFSATTIGNSTLGMVADDFAGALVRITRGTGATQERAVIANTATTLTVTPPWTVKPDTTSYFVVADATWNFGGVGATSPVEIRGAESGRARRWRFRGDRRTCSIRRARTN